MMGYLRSRRSARAATTGLLSAALLVGMSGCGSSSSASTGSSSSGGSASAAPGASSAGSRYQARLALAKCLRAHGLNVPDPSPNGGPAGGAPGGGGGFRALRDQPNFSSAMQACAKYRGAASPLGNLTPQQRAQFQQDLVKFAQCMRAHNINMPDPSASTSGGFRIFRQVPESERNSPAFRSALQACSTNLPFRRGGGGPGAPGGNGANPGA